VTIARTVAPGRENEFEDWSARLTRAAALWPGFLGAGLLRPGHVGEPWHVVFRFATGADLAAWDASPERAAILAAGEPLVHATASHQVSGLETWFALPGRTAPAPPRWKMFLVSAAAIYLLNILLTTLYGGFIAGWPTLGRVALVSVPVTALMTWVVMPPAARALERWLYAPRRAAGRKLSSWWPRAGRPRTARRPSR
jgi:antibiotic biosynthesis monooxygenase (ABM) superfamily enzyme